MPWYDGEPKSSASDIDWSDVLHRDSYDDSVLQSPPHSGAASPHEPVQGVFYDERSNLSYTRPRNAGYFDQLQSEDTTVNADSPISDIIRALSRPMCIHCGSTNHSVTRCPELRDNICYQCGRSSHQCDQCPFVFCSCCGCWGGHKEDCPVKSRNARRIQHGKRSDYVAKVLGNQCWKCAILVGRGHPEVAKQILDRKFASHTFWSCPLEAGAVCLGCGAVGESSLRPCSRAKRTAHPAPICIQCGKTGHSAAECTRSDPFRGIHDELRPFCIPPLSRPDNTKMRNFLLIMKEQLYSRGDSHAGAGGRHVAFKLPRDVWKEQSSTRNWKAGSARPRQ